MGRRVSSVPSFDAAGSPREPAPLPRPPARSADDRGPAAVSPLRAIAAAFERRVPDETLRALVNTRVLLRTGVNLRAIAAGDHADTTDPTTAPSVLRALEQLGYPLDPSSP